MASNVWWLYTLVLALVATFFQVNAYRGPPAVDKWKALRQWQLADEISKRSSASMSGPWRDQAEFNTYLSSIVGSQSGENALMQRSSENARSAAYSMEGGDDELGMVGQDDAKKAKLRNKACFFKICSFNTRALRR